MDLDAFLDRVREQARDAERLKRSLRVLRGDRVLSVHAYAWDAYEAFMRKFYSDGRPRIFAISMNPGPFGAVQTGIPFCDRAMARRFLANFHDLVTGPPAWAASERNEMSAARLVAWSERRFGGIEALYGRILLAMTCPLAVLRGARRTNVPLPALPGPAKRQIEDFIRRHAADEIALARPTGVLLLGDWAQRVWRLALGQKPALSALPCVVAPHPAAHISNAAKFRAWSRSFARLDAWAAAPGSGAG